MKILVITVFPPMKAPEADYALHLCDHLADYGLDVHVVTTKKSITASHPGIAVYPIMQDWSWSDLPRLAMFMRRCSPDAVFLMYIGWIYNYQPMMTFLPTISKTLLPRVPFVTQFTGPYGAHPNQTSLLDRAIRKAVVLWAGKKKVDYNFGTLLCDSDRIVVMSEVHRAWLSDHFPGVNGKSVLIPPPPIMRISPENNGMSRQQTREIFGVKSEDFLIAYFGYVYGGKGVETLFKAFRIVSNQRSNLRLMIVGGMIEPNSENPDSSLEELYAMPRQLGIDDKVAWTGEYAWDSDEASRYLRAADVCVFPFDKGVYLNNSSFAAAAVHELPIIATQAKILEQPFIHLENVFLCAPRNPEAMAAAIETLISSPDLRARLRAGARDLAQEWFSWDRVIERITANMNITEDCSKRPR